MDNSRKISKKGVKRLIFITKVEKSRQFAKNPAILLQHRVGHAFTLPASGAKLKAQKV